ncbi:hypothetical protein CR513_13873, partial [Mucuna pruriens]
MESVMVGNATKVSFVLWSLWLLSFHALRLALMIEEAYKIALDAYVLTPKDVTNELNLHHSSKEEEMARLIAMSNSGDVAYGFNCSGMFKGYATKDGLWRPKLRMSQPIQERSDPIEASRPKRSSPG